MKQSGIKIDTFYAVEKDEIPRCDGVCVCVRVEKDEIPQCDGVCVCV